MYDSTKSEIVAELARRTGWHFDLVGDCHWHKTLYYTMKEHRELIIDAIYHKSINIMSLRVLATILESEEHMADKLRDAGFSVLEKSITVDERTERNMCFSVQAGYGLTDFDLADHTPTDANDLISLWEKQLTDIRKGVAILEGGAEEAPAPDKKLEGYEENNNCEYCNAFQSFTGGLNHEKDCPNKTASIFTNRRNKRLSKYSDLAMMSGVEEDVITPIIDSLSRLEPNGLWDVDMQFSTDSEQNQFTHEITAKGFEGSSVSIKIRTSTPTKMKYILGKIQFSVDFEARLTATNVSNSILDGKSSSLENMPYRTDCSWNRNNRNLHARHYFYDRKFTTQKQLQQLLDKELSDLHDAVKYMLFYAKDSSGRKHQMPKQIV